MNDKIDILFAATDSYVPYLTVALVSIFENNKENDFLVHIICSDLTCDNKEILKHLSDHYGQELHLIQPDLEMFQVIVNMKDKMPSKYHLSTFYRLFVTEWLPEDINRIIYLDCDLIVTGNLRSLWKEDMDENTALCATHDFVRIDDYHRLQINPIEHIYFNAGVLLINLTYWRSHSVGKCCVDYICTYPERILMADQEALNATLAGKVKYIHPKYNTMTFYFAKEKYLGTCVWYGDMEAIIEAVKSPVVVHFAGEKPWFKGEYLPYQDEWMKYLSITDWKDMKIRYNGGWKGKLKFIIRKTMYYFLRKVSNTYRIMYPVSIYKKRV